MATALSVVGALMLVYKWVTDKYRVCRVEEQRWWCFETRRRSHIVRQQSAGDWRWRDRRSCGVRVFSVGCRVDHTYRTSATKVLLFSFPCHIDVGCRIFERRSIDIYTWRRDRINATIVACSSSIPGVFLLIIPVALVKRNIHSKHRHYRDNNIALLMFLLRELLDGISDFHATTIAVRHGLSFANVGRHCICCHVLQSVSIVSDQVHRSTLQRHCRQHQGFVIDFLFCGTHHQNNAVRGFRWRLL